MHSHSRRQLILESGCSHQVAVFPLCQCPLFLHLFLLLQLCMASRQTGQKFFWFIFWLQASLHHQLLNVLISLFKLSQAVQAKQKNACLLAGRSARFLPAQFTILFGDLKVCYTIVLDLSITSIIIYQKRLTKYRSVFVCFWNTKSIFP